MGSFRFLLLIKIIISFSVILAIIILFECALYFKNLFLKRTIILLSFVLTLVYLCWRLFYTTPHENSFYLLLFIILISAEILDCFNSFVLKAAAWKSYVPPVISISAKMLSVDVLIMTYRENVSLLEKTVKAAACIKYPKNLFNIFVCDDGNRKEVKELCQRLGVSYISRDIPLNAKAGNINNALSHTKGELVLILDADMIPREDFFEKTIGYFENPKVGFVQVPQVFYNHDPFQYNLYLYNCIHNEQDLFMRYIQSNRANYNAVIHVGTNAIFRRKALEDIGGIPCFSITEDIATGILIQSMGYQGIYLNEELAVGLAPESFRDFVRQRIRWCRGAIQTFKRLKPLFIKGLNLKQKILYLDSFLYWLFGIKKLIYILFPLLYVYFGFRSFFAHFEDIILFFFPHLLASVFSFRLISNRARSFFMSHVYEMSVAVVIAYSFIAEAFLRKLSVFHVTPKGEEKRQNLILYMPCLILYLLFLRFLPFIKYSCLHIIS